MSAHIALTILGKLLLARSAYGLRKSDSVLAKISLQSFIGPFLARLKKRQANHGNNLSLSVASQTVEILLLHSERESNGILDRKLT